jgi:hypothetical protein
MRGRWAASALLMGIMVCSSCSPGETVNAFGDGAWKFRVVNRKAYRIEERKGVRLSRDASSGIAWIEGTNFQSGTIELDVRGKEWLRQTFVGVAFHRKDDETYEAVYLRPFNFRTSDPIRKQHAVQYIALPQFDYDRLRIDFPEEFENPVDQSIEPTDWVRLRVVVQGAKVQIYVGTVTQVTLEVRKLGQLYSGQVGLWVGNESGGDFANLVITPAK